MALYITQLTTSFRFKWPFCLKRSVGCCLHLSWPSALLFFLLSMTKVTYIWEQIAGHTLTSLETINDPPGVESLLFNSDSPSLASTHAILCHYSHIWVFQASQNNCLSGFLFGAHFAFSFYSLPTDISESCVQILSHIILNQMCVMLKHNMLTFWALSLHSLNELKHTQDNHLKYLTTHTLPINIRLVGVSWIRF